MKLENGMSEAVTYKKYPLGNYMLGDDGSIFSLTKGLFLKPKINNTGYRQINVRENGKSISRLLHRMIAHTFFGYSNLTVNHKNKVRLDNRLENLEYMTLLENYRHAWKDGRGKRFVTKLALPDKWYIQFQTPALGKKVCKSIVCKTKEEAYEKARQFYFETYGVYPW
jgi:hypothetical protein